MKATLAGRGGKQDDLFVVPPFGGSAPTGRDKDDVGFNSLASVEFTMSMIDRLCRPVGASGSFPTVTQGGVPDGRLPWAGLFRPVGAESQAIWQFVSMRQHHRVPSFPRFHRSIAHSICRRTTSRSESIHRCGSFPHIFLVDVDFVSEAQLSELVLKRGLLVVLFLVGDVGLHGFDVRLADREDSVTGLPMELGELRSFGLQPFGRLGLDRFHQIHDRQLPREIAQHMHMIFNTVNQNGWAVDVDENPAHVFEKLLANRRIAQPRRAVLGAEDQMYDNAG